jgi:hypothetical protein
MHWLAVMQAKEVKPEGSDCSAQVLPPSAVVATNPAERWVAFPTAIQALDVEHEIDVIAAWAESEEPLTKETWSATRRRRRWLVAAVGLEVGAAPGPIRATTRTTTAMTTSAAEAPTTRTRDPRGS